MEEVEIDVLDGFNELLQAMRRRRGNERKNEMGFLLVSADGQGKPNVMTLTWLGTG
ncbi:unnamed protein product, partial [marine sediment metagenome]